MDQNLARTDLLPESISLWVLLLLAIIGIAAWVGCHWAVKRYATKFKPVYRFAMSIPAGIIGSWLVFQALARVTFLATPWSLFFGSLLTAVSFEGVCALYAHECARIAPKIARLLVACRLGAIGVVILMMMQPVVVGERSRTVSRRVVVLVDDSASMHFVDKQWTDAERVNVAYALGKASISKDAITGTNAVAEATAWFAKQSEAEKKRLIEVTEVTRCEIIRQLLARGGEKSFLNRLAAKYQVDVFRFGHGARRDESYLEKLPANGEVQKDDPDAPLSTREQLFRSATDITRALEIAMREVPPEEIASVILVTDGRHNGDAGVESISRKLGSLGIAVSSVVVGGSTPPFDLAISSADCPESVFLGDKLRFNVTVGATQAMGKKAKLKLSLEGVDSGGAAKLSVLEEKEFSIDSNDWTKEFRFVLKPDDRKRNGLQKKGVYRYHLQVTTLQGELFAENNEWALDVAVSDDRTNVLLVDNRPRWEFRYLRNLFYGRDKSVHLQDFLLRPDMISGQSGDPLPPASASRPFGESESGNWPQGIEEWRKFDVIIIGDLSDEQIPADVVKNLKYCVEERGALLVFIAGPESMPYRVRNEALRDLMPIEYDPDGLSHRMAVEPDFQFSLAPAGRGHAVMSQSSSSAENEDIWEQMPDFHWRVPVKGVKPGADVLAFAKPKGDQASNAIAAQAIAATIEENPEAALKRLEEMRGEQSRNSLVVATSKGRGHVLMINTDQMWRLRYRVGDTFHHRFWGQVLRWGAGEKLRAGNSFVRLGTDQLRYDVGSPITVIARIVDGGYNSLPDIVPTAVLMNGNGVRLGSYVMEQRPDSNGFYECVIPPNSELFKPGQFRVQLACQRAAELLGPGYPARLEARFVVVTAKQPAEKVDITSSTKMVQRMAQATQGRVVTPAEYVGLDEDFGGGSKLMRDRVEFQVWCLPPLFLLAIALLTTEWILRKRATLA